MSAFVTALGADPRIVAPDGAYDYQNKYFTDVVRYECPCGLPAATHGTVDPTSGAACCAARPDLAGAAADAPAACC